MIVDKGEITLKSPKVKFTKKFEIVSLGEKEEVVYDLEVQDNHNFFGNGILLHNSAYYTIKPFVEEYLKEHPDAGILELVEFADKFEEQNVQPIIEDTINEFSRNLNAFNPSKIGAKKEIFADCLHPKTKIRILDVSCNEWRFCTLEELYQNPREAYTKTLGDNGVEIKRILNVQKKYSSKQFVNVTNGSFTIICTEDHKIAVYEHPYIFFKEAKDITPKDLLIYNYLDALDLMSSWIQYTGKTEDGIIVPWSTVSGFSAIPVDYLGVCYDLEIEGNHNFFADNILVHNCMIMVAKKKYVARVRENEGTIYPEDSPKIKIMGLELIKGGTPAFTKKYLMQSLDYLFDKTNDEMLEWFDQIKQEFTKCKISDISIASSCNNLEYDLKDSLSVPIAARASLYYNDYVTKNNLLDQYTLIQPGDKVRVVYLNPANPFAKAIRRNNGKVLEPNVIAFVDDAFGELLKPYVDYDVQFQKAFVSPLSIMSNAVSFSVKKKLPNVFDF